LKVEDESPVLVVRWVAVGNLVINKRKSIWCRGWKRSVDPPLLSGNTTLGALYFFGVISMYENARQTQLFDYAKELKLPITEQEKVAWGDDFLAFNAKLNPPLSEDEMAEVFDDVSAFHGDTLDERRAQKRMWRYEMIRIGSKYLALDKNALKKGEIVAYTRNEWLEGPGNISFTRHMVQVTPKLNKTTGEWTNEEKPVDQNVHAGLAFWNEKCKGWPKSLVFRPGGDFDPETEINTWQGWGVEPSAEGSCELFKKHLKDVVCGGDADLYSFLWDWFADIFQHPGHKNGVAVAWRGEQGDGKSFVGEQVMCKLLGNAYVLINDPETLTGKFNSHLANRLFVHLDEAFFSGDHQVRSKIKGLITSPFNKIELKGREPYFQDNNMRIFITTNADWATPSEQGDRRYFVLDIQNPHRNDPSYFDPLFAELENGGYGKLLWDLLHTAIASDWHRVPETEAKREQIRNGSAVLQWWHDSEEHWQEDVDEIYIHAGEEISPTEAWKRFMKWAERAARRSEMPRGVEGFSKTLAKVGIKSVSCFKIE
jgi:hypothetical protein